MEERRRSPRLRSFLGGQIAIAQHRSSMDCLIRNVSPGGAKLVFWNTLAVSDAFELFITQRQQNVRVRIVWRRAEEIGVRFLESAPEARVIPLDAARRIRSLEAEKASLQRRLAELTSE